MIEFHTTILTNFTSKNGTFGTNKKSIKLYIRYLSAFDGIKLSYFQNGKY